MSKKKIKKKKPKLTKLEKQVFQLLVDGKDLDEVMSDLDLDVVKATEILLNLQKSIMYGIKPKR